MTDKTHTFETNVQPLPALKIAARAHNDAEQLPEAGLPAPLESGQRSRKHRKVTRDIVIRLIDWFEAA
jgi:hypothetical protein